MGSQIMPELPADRSRRIKPKIDKFSPGSPRAAEQASSAGAEAMGPVSKTSAFIQDLSNSSVQKGVASLIELASDLNVAKMSTDEVLSDLGVKATNDRPLAELTLNLRKRLREDLMAEQRSTESALAIEDAMSQSVMDFINLSNPSIQAQKATRAQVAQAFKGVSSREIVNVVMKHVITNLIARVLDAARGDTGPGKVAKMTGKINEGLAEALAKKIDQLARVKGISPSKIPSNIPKWTKELEAVVSKYRTS